MTPFFYALALAILVSMPCLAQNVASPNVGPPSSSAPGEKAGLPSPDNSSAQAEQAAKPAEDKGHTTIVGCLSGPDKEGRYALRSMSHRTGVEVFGSDHLKSASGSKVKLTGLWKPGDQPAEPGGAKKARKFEVTDLEVMAAKCAAPTEKTPISKEKQLKQQQEQDELQQQQKQQQQQNSANPAASGDTSNPK